MSLFKHRWVKRTVVVVTAVALLVGVFHLAGGWYFSNVLHDDALDAANRRAELVVHYGVQVLAADATQITLDPSGSSKVRRPGVWGVAWPDGYGIVREIVDDQPGRVARSFEVVSGSAPMAGTLVDVQERAFPDDPSAVLGVEPEVVQVPGPLGDYESWFFHGSSSTWVLMLHGNTPDRLDLARLLPTVRALGHPVLLVSLRNDPGAPPDPSGMFRYGSTEWTDLEAAVDYATGHGASDVVLIGPSMGGGVVMSFLERSASAGAVRAVVLDAPMLDFRRTVDFQAAHTSIPLIGLPVPPTLTATAEWMAGWRFDLDWSDLDYLTSVDRLHVPVLVFHGTKDDDVPIATSRELARARPDLVTLVEVEGATHLTAWNTDPDAYDRELTSFLTANAA